MSGLVTEKVLVIGAQPYSLGYHVALAAEQAGYVVVTAGINGEDLTMDVRDSWDVKRVVQDTSPTHVVCTVGVNRPGAISAVNVLDSAMMESLLVNTVGPMRILQEWLEVVKFPGHYVAVSSNSAHVARSDSIPYCASKAALSMAIRCAARDVAKASPDGAPHAAIYGYEFGLLAGTPMTQETEERFGRTQTRIPAQPKGLRTPDVAETIVRNLQGKGWHLNGCMIRLDGGEQ